MNKIAVGDADGLISLALTLDPNHGLAVAGTTDGWYPKLGHNLFTTILNK